jgi:EmrB/QacA subfamily drug resistance transporter
MSTAASIKADRSARAYAWRVLSVTSLGAILSSLNISALNVALPVVARHFHASAASAPWLLLLYMITTTVMMLNFGRVADMTSRRELYIGGMALLTLSSLACGLAPNIVVLQAFRVAQAIGAGALITNTTAIITDAFPRDILPVGLSIQLTLVAAAQVAGPSLGGLLAQELGWRAVFWFNVPGGVVGVVWAMVSLRKVPRRPRRAETFDFVSAFLSLLILGGLITALSEGSALGWITPLVLVSACVFLITLPLFIWRQHRLADPLVDLALFGSWPRSSAYIANLLLAAIRLGVVLLVGLYLQSTGTQRTGIAGAVVSAVAAGIVLTSPVSGWMARHIRPQIMCTAGMVLAAAALIMLGASLGPGMSAVLIGGLLLLIGIGSGLFTTPNTASIMTSVPAERRGIANAVRSTSQNTGYALSTAALLGIATAPLPRAEKQLAYRGELSDLAPAAVGQFTMATHTALFALAALALFAAAISYSRGRNLLNEPERHVPLSARSLRAVLGLGVRNRLLSRS